jgi:uncharacterized YigZ family protein
LVCLRKNNLHMLDQHYYYCIEKSVTAEFTDRGSRFIAYAFPIASIEDFKECLNEVKKSHPKASHYCFAYRLGHDGSIYRVTDAGEPSGSAGRPILGQIDSRHLTNTLVVVVRYFGGTLLGVPGLINAYKSTASMALQLTPILKKKIEVDYEIQFDYTVMNEVMMVIKKYEFTVLHQEQHLFSVFQIGIPILNQKEVLEKFAEIRGVDIKKKAVQD